MNISYLCLCLNLCSHDYAGTQVFDNIFSMITSSCGIVYKRAPRITTSLPVSNMEFPGTELHTHIHTDPPNMNVKHMSIIRDVSLITHFYMNTKMDIFHTFSWISITAHHHVTFDLLMFVHACNKYHRHLLTVSQLKMKA